MPSWLIKSAIHRGISWLPKPQFWNGLFQDYVTKSTQFNPARFNEKLIDGRRHYDAYRAAHPAGDFSVMELGTGWLPVIPLGFYLCGASKIWSVDIDPLLRTDRLRKILQYFVAAAKSGELAKLLPDFRPDRVGHMESVLNSTTDAEAPSALLARFNMEVMVRDAQQTPIPDGAVDFIYSNGVLEYIPRPVLQGIFREYRRIAKPGAVMSHRFNLVDQFAYFDSSITAFNFLRYTEAEWKWRNSPLIWQNRLRISDFRQIITEGGFEIIKEESESGSPADLKKITLAPEFAHYAEADLLVIHSFITATKK